MIILHTIKGQELALNGGLIERVEQDNETHVTLATGTSYLVREAMEEVVRLHRLDRAKVRVLATRLSKDGEDRDLEDFGEGELLEEESAPRSRRDAPEEIEETEEPFGYGSHTILPFPSTGGREA